MHAHHVFIRAILAFLLFPLLALTAHAATITVTAPTPGQVLPAGSNAPLAATVNLPADKVKKVEFFRNGYRIASLTTPTSSTAGSTTWTTTWVKPAANTYLITAEVTDTAGTVTESAQVRLEVDKPPTVKLVSPKAGATYKAPASVFLDVEASDPDGSIARVEFWQGTTKLGQATGYTFEYTWKNIPAGTYSLFARAYDDFGLYTDTPPVSITVTGSTTPTPTTVTLTQPANNASITLPATLNLAASVSGTASIASVAFYDGATLIGSDSSSPYAVDWVTPTPGTHTLTAKAIDSAGVVTSSAPVTVTVTAGEVQGIFFIHADHLGTPRLIADEQQRTVWRWDNDEPFGDNPPDEDPGKTGQRFEFNLRFPGQYFDKETGLSYNYFRDYDPGAGRYVQSDPIGLAGGVNTYSYVEGNPLSSSDFLGLRRDNPFGINGPLAGSGGGGVIPLSGGGRGSSGGSGSGLGSIATGVAGLGSGLGLMSGVGIGNLIYAKPYIDDPQADADHDAYKKRYDQPPPPFKDPCDELRWRLKREEQLLRDRQAWDAKWLPGRHSEMGGEIQSENAIRKLKDKLKRLGCDCP